MAGERIKVICHGCGARYQVRADKVRGRRFRATCKKCGGIIVAHCSNAAGFTVLPAGSGGGGHQGTPMRLDHDELRSYQEHEEEVPWYVVIGGKPHGPLSTDQVRQSFRAGRISERTYLWRAGDPEWRRLGEVPEFMELGADHTGHYTPDETTGETRAAGPMGMRKQAVDGLDDHLEPGEEEERTSFYQGQVPEDSESEATKFHVRPDEPHMPVPEPSPVPPQDQWQMPVIPPRKAVLPAPSGVRSPMRQSMRQSAPLPSPTADHTRPLSDRERAEAQLGVKHTDPQGELNLLPSLAPSLADDPDAPLPPPPKSAFSQSLKPIGPPAGPALLSPATEPFWTTGKIAAAAAIGGGLAVAMAVVVVVSLVRPKPKPVVAKATVAATKSAATAPETKPKKAESSPATSVKPAPKPEPAAKEEAAKAEVAPAAAPEEPVKDEPAEPQAAPQPKEPAGAAKGPTRVSLRKKPKRSKPKRSRRRRSKKSGVDSEVDSLLAGGRSRSKSSRGSSKSSKSSGPVDPDALLAAGTGGKPKRKKPRGTPSPDDLLAVGSKPHKRGRPNQAEIQSIMRKVVPRVRGCYDKYKMAGRANVSITLRPSGKFDARVLGPFAGTPTGYCVLAGVNKARFPAFTGKAIRFAYPFDLR